jgi:hypothetical protein
VYKRQGCPEKREKINRKERKKKEREKAIE